MDFARGARALEQANPRLKHVGERTSAGDANLALTYTFHANNADEIIALLEQVEKIPDLRVVL